LRTDHKEIEDGEDSHHHDEHLCIRTHNLKFTIYFI
jgi:hypothetical protein